MRISLETVRSLPSLDNCGEPLQRAFITVLFTIRSSINRSTRIIEFMSEIICVVLVCQNVKCLCMYVYIHVYKYVCTSEFYIYIWTWQPPPLRFGKIAFGNKMARRHDHVGRRQVFLSHYIPFSGTVNSCIHQV